MAANTQLGQRPVIKVKVKDNTSLQATVPVTLKNTVYELKYLNQLADVTVNAAANGDILTFSSAANDWINSSFSFSGTANEVEVTRTGFHSYQFGLPNNTVVANALFVGTTFTTNSTYTYIANGNFDNVFIANGTILNGTLTLQDIIPDANNAYTIGTANLRFRSLYLSGNTLYMGNVVFEDTATSLALNTANGQPISVAMGNTTVSGTLNVSSTFTAAAINANTLTVYQTSNLAGNAAVGGSLSVAGQTNVAGNLNVTGTINRNPNINIILTGDVTGTANATMADLTSVTITVNTTSQADSVELGVDTTGPYVANIIGGTGVIISNTTGGETAVPVISIGQNVATTSAVTFGNTTINGFVNVTSTASVGNTSVTGFINVSSTANVGGAITARSDVTVNGQLTVANTAAVGNTSVAGFINVTSTANVGGILTARSDVTVNGQLTVANTAALGNTTVTGFINVSSTANIGGAVTARSTVTVNGALTVANTAALGNTTVTGFANVVGNLQVTDTIAGNNMTLSGNLTVSGTTTYINTTNLNVGDNIITLNADLGAVAPTENAGIEVNRGSAANVSFLWNETNDYWDIGNTNVVGFVNATSSVNALSHTVGTSFIANATGVYHTGVVNAASHTTTLVTANATGVYVGSNVYANATTMYVGNSTSQTIIANGAVIAGQSTGGQISVGGDPNGGLEIGQTGRAVSGNPYIDFHSSANSPDFDVRIQVSGGNTTSGSGNLQIQANVVNLPNTVITGTVGGITTLAAGNTTITGWANVSTSVNSAILSVGTNFIANSTGVTTTGFVNATASVNSAVLSVGTAVIANSVGVTTTGFVNAAGAVNAASHTVGTSLVANSVGITTTGFVNAAGAVNAASHTVGTSFVANSTGVVAPLQVVVSGGGATSEGGQLVLGYGNNLASSIVGQTNNTWNIDVFGGNTGSTPLLRVYAQNGDGSTAAGFNIANTGRMHVGSTIEQTDSTFKVTGSANVTTSLTVGTTLAAGNTTVTGFVNATAGVNTSVLTVGTNFIANTTGAYHTGTVNAASFTTTGVTANVTGVYVGANVSVTTTGWSIGNTTTNAVANSTMLVFGSNPTQGIGFYSAGNTYSISMKPQNDAAAGRLDGVSDFNMYFNMNAGTNRGFVFRAGNTTSIPVAQIDGIGALYTLGSHFIGNSTVNATISATTLSINTVSTNVGNFAVSANVGSNVNISTSQISVGNATVNTVITSSSLATGNTTVTGFINVTSTANIGGAVNARSTLTVNGALIVANTASLGNTTITGFANVVGNLQVSNLYATGSVQIDGDLVVSGNTITINATDLAITDNLIYLNEAETDTITSASSNGTAFLYTANNGLTVGMVVTVTGVSPSGYNVTANTITFANATHFAVANTTSPGAYVSGGTAVAQVSTNPDIGFVGNYNDGTYRHAGFFRDATDGVWKVFDQFVPEPNGAFIDTSNNTFRIADFQANNTVLGSANVAGIGRIGVGSANYIQIAGAASASAPYILANGSDTDVPLILTSKNAGAVIVKTVGGGPTQFQVSHTASAVNYLQATGATTGAGPILSAQGTDTNIPISIIGKGTGHVNLGSNQANYWQAYGSASAAGSVTMFAWGSDTNLNARFESKGTGGVHLRTGNGGLQFVVADTASAVNYIQVTGNATGAGPILSAQGSDSNIDLLYSAKGTAGSHVFRTNGTVRQFQVNHVTSAVNYVTVVGSTTGTAPVIGVAGSDTNIDFIVAAKGTGNVVSNNNLTVVQTSNTTLKVWANTATTPVADVELQCGQTAIWGGDAFTDYRLRSSGGNFILQSQNNATSVLDLFTVDEAGNTLRFAPAGIEQFRVLRTSAAVNYLQVAGGATGAGPTLSTQGSDTNADFNVASKGTGSVRFSTGGGEQFRINDRASATTFLAARGGVNGGNALLGLSGTGSTEFVIHSLGTGALRFMTNGVGQEQLRVTHTASAVNYLQVTGAATGSGPTISAQGSDTNIALNVAAKASANININSNTNFAANTLTFTGSAGSNTNIALRVLNDGVLSFEGGVGQLFSISNSMSGQIFAVNDISGIPSIEVYSNGQVNIARFGGNVSIGTSTSTTTVNGSVTFANAVTFANNLTITGFVNATASVNSAVLSVGTSVIANTSGVTTTGYANVGTTVSIGSNVIANTTAIFIGNSTVNTVITQTTAAFNANTTNTALFVAANGNVGIQTNTPSGYRLQVNGSVRMETLVSVGGASTFSIDAPNISNGRLFVTTDPTGNGTNGSPNANVGIGNTNPQHKLSVNGNGFFGSSLNVATTFASGNATITGFANVVGNLQVTDTITGNNMTLSGNLTVTGTTTYINTTNLDIGDNIITLNADLGAVAPTENAGFVVNRGTGANVQFIWNESGKRWDADAGNSDVNELRLVSNTYIRSLSMVAGGLADSWGNTTNTSAFATFSVASGVNKFRTQNRDYIIANTATDMHTFAANGNVGIGNAAPAGARLVVENSVDNNNPTVLVRNTNAGTSAITSVSVRGDTAGAQLDFGVASNTYSGYGLIAANGAYILSKSVNGLGIFADNASSFLRFGAGGTSEHMRLNANGGLYVGVTGDLYGRQWMGIYNRNQNAVTQLGVINANTGSSAQARFSLITGTGNSFMDWGLNDNAGAPTSIMGFGSAVSTFAITVSNASGAFRVANSTVTAFHVSTANGNVGIGNTTPGQTLVVNGTANISGTVAHGGLVMTTGTNVDQIFTATPSITLNTTWQSTGVTSTNLANGTYIVQLLANDVAAGGTANNEYYSGIMSWYSADTNSTILDEIPLHRAGVNGSNNSIFLATQRTPTANTSDLILMISSAANNTSASTYTLRFRRMI